MFFNDYATRDWRINEINFLKINQFQYNLYPGIAQQQGFERMKFWNVELSSSEFRAEYLSRKKIFEIKKKRVRKKKTRKKKKNWGYDCPGNIGNGLFLRYECTLFLKSSI